MIEEITTPLIFANFLVFCRIGAGIMMMPGLSENYISAKARLVAALGLTLVLTPVVQSSLPLMPSSMVGLALLAAGEILIGSLIGSTAKILLSALHVAGTTISYQTGLAAATFFDPTQGGQSSTIGVFLTTMAIMLLFATELHHIFIQGLSDSYALFSPGAPIQIGSFTDIIAKTFSGSFEVGVKIAAPQIVIGLLLYLGAGVMSRLMPQMHIFFVMMPVQIALGFFVLMTTLSAGMMWFLDYYAEVIGGLIIIE